MNNRIRQLFETHTVPAFSVGSNLDLSKNERGEYLNPTLEDHWQTFQEAAELIVAECADAADMAHDCHCAFPGDYVVEHMEYGVNEGAAQWRTIHRLKNEQEN